MSVLNFQFFRVGFSVGACGDGLRHGDDKTGHIRYFFVCYFVLFSLRLLVSFAVVEPSAVSYFVLVISCWLATLLITSC